MTIPPAIPDWLDSTTAADAIGPAGAIPSFVQPLRHDCGRSIGFAETALASLDDNGVVYQILEMPAPVEILVIAGGACSRTAVIGALFARELYQVGYRALITDGPVRDAAELATLPLAVWSRGAATAASTKLNRGHLGLPVSIGGVTVCPGDLVVADRAGVVVWPQARVEYCLIAAAGKHDADSARLSKLLASSEDRRS